MCHADLRREAAAVITAKPASALLQDTVVLPGLGVWECLLLWWDERWDEFKNAFD